MGVSLGYQSKRPVAGITLEELQTAIQERNAAREWWSEGIHLFAQPNEAGNLYGSTKLFRMISDSTVDTYMVYLDLLEIADFLASSGKRFGIEWQLDIDGAPLGETSAAGPDPELQETLETFLDMFPGDFESLEERSREAILADWPE